jgi:Cu+-exporting ATPase
LLSVPVSPAAVSTCSLIGLGISVAWIQSSGACPGIFPPSFREPDGSIGLYFEPAAIITTLILLGQVLELSARSRTGAAVRALLNLAPKTARRVRGDGTEEDVALDSVQVGDRLRVREGETVPVDGVVLEGASAIEQIPDHRQAIPEKARATASSARRSGNDLPTTEGRCRNASSRIVAMVAEAQRATLDQRLAIWLLRPDRHGGRAVTFAAVNRRPAAAHYPLVNIVIS